MLLIILPMATLFLKAVTVRRWASMHKCRTLKLKMINEIHSLFILLLIPVLVCRCEKGSNCVTGEKFYSVPEMYLWSLGWLSWHIYIAIIKLPDPKSYSQDTKMFREYQAWKLLCLQELWDIWVFMTARRGVLNLAGFTELNTESDPKSPSHQLSCWLLHFKWLKLGWTHGTFWLSCL